ncbi:MAG: protein-disulfide reductase DsbD [Gammaproteobacteria bacterium]|nr:protein-disulfide reductase DsbD [Gammaproteobacteria bacterium]
MWLLAAALTMPSGYADEPVSSGVMGAISSLGERLGLKKADEKFLEPDRAFVLSVDAVNGGTVRARWDIAEGYYLYKNKFGFDLKDAPGVSLGKFSAPQGQFKSDPNFGQVEVYHDQVVINLPVTRAAATPANIMLEARYQGCADAGFCYPPITRRIALTLPAGASAFAPAADTGAAGLPEQDRYARSLASGNTALTLLSFFGVGLLLAFTPCMFPMIPILSSIIVGQGERVGARRAFTLSLSYVLAMAVAYTVAGVLAGLFGGNLQAVFQNPWILGSFAAVFVLLALSMFGFYDLQLPASWQGKLATMSNHQRGGSHAGVAVMGLLSALIVGPCIAAPLAGALIYIGQSGDAVLGGSALFALSLGMGIPLLVIGASAGKLLPKAGDWMNAIKAVFGVMLLAVAIWMLERIIPAQVTMVLWAVLLIISAVYMGALAKLPLEASGWSKLWKGTGLVMLIYGGLLMFGAAGGGSDVLQPLRGTQFTGGAAGISAAERPLPFKPVKGLAGLNREIAVAAASGKPVMLDFYADWCVSCKEMEKKTFADGGVRRMLADVVLLQADVTANDAEDQALLKQYGLFGPPSILFFGADGQERRDRRLMGFLEADEFRAHLSAALAI